MRARDFGDHPALTELDSAKSDCGIVALNFEVASTEVESFHARIDVIGHFDW